jgi:hypothetical protein
MEWHRDGDNDKADLTEVDEVIAEAHRLLSGRTFDAQRGCRRRGWALIGALAHSDRAELKKLAGAGISSHPASAIWDSVLAYLAGEVLDAAPSDPALVQVQRQVLIPLELQLLGADVRGPSSPRELATAVLASLDAHPIHPDR